MATSKVVEQVRDLHFAGIDYVDPLRRISDPLQRIYMYERGKRFYRPKRMYMYDRGEQFYRPQRMFMYHRGERSYRPQRMYMYDRGERFYRPQRMFMYDRGERFYRPQRMYSRIRELAGLTLDTTRPSPDGELQSR